MITHRLLSFILCLLFVNEQVHAMMLNRAVRCGAKRAAGRGLVHYVQRVTPQRERELEATKTVQNGYSFGIWAGILAAWSFKNLYDAWTSGPSEEERAGQELGMWTRQGLIDFLTYCEEHNVNPNHVISPSGTTALMIASCTPNVEDIFKFLVEFEDVNFQARNNQGLNALTFAAGSHNMQAVKLLVRCSQDGIDDALSWAAENNRKDVQSIITNELALLSDDV